MPSSTLFAALLTLVLSVGCEKKAKKRDYTTSAPHAALLDRVMAGLKVETKVQAEPLHLPYAKNLRTSLQSGWVPANLMESCNGLVCFLLDFVVQA